MLDEIWMEIVCRTCKHSGENMYFFKKWSFLIVSGAILLSIVGLISGCQSKYEDLDLTMYEYRDTKDLVKFVYDAALTLKKDGMKSLDYFRNNRNLFKTRDYYLYIYDMNGTNIYHAGMEHLEGKNLLDITDKDGKKSLKMALNALADENNPHSWVHYSWWEPGKFYPVPKSSCHFKVKTIDGKEYFVGAGLDYPHEEKEFIRIVVEDAVQLIKERGPKAFSDIANPVLQYSYRDVRIFAFRPDGEILLSPVTGDNLSQIKLLECIDEVGHKPFEKALKELESKDSVWEVFMAKQRYQRQFIKKCLYLRKMVVSGEKIYVGAITDLPHPV